MTVETTQRNYPAFRTILVRWVATLPGILFCENFNSKLSITLSFSSMHR
jgi:hypothetical protein